MLVQNQNLLYALWWSKCCCLPATYSSPFEGIICTKPSLMRLHQNDCNRFVFSNIIFLNSFMQGNNFQETKIIAVSLV